ncbi:XRE family transcriptional regulator [Lactobacillus amylovorus]|nr:XRE family transcriptional regulator [Lactobacillus amylovorus]
MNRLNELRTQNNLTFRQLSEKLKEMGIKISPDSLAKYERGDREPKIDKWQALANFFNVSVPYLQGIEDKRNNGYSKEHIYKCLDDAYKEPYVKGYEVEPPFTSPFLSAMDVINNYCEQNKISIPKDTDLDFWKTNFNFIFKDKSVNRLLTTKDKYSDSDIKELIINVIYWYGLNPHTRELVNKLSHNS